MSVVGKSVSAGAHTETNNEDVEDMEALFNDDDDDENSFSISRTVAETGYVKDEEGNLAFGSKAPIRPDSSLSMTSTVDGENKRERQEYRSPIQPKVRLQPAFQSGASEAENMTYSSVNLSGDDDTIIFTRKRCIPDKQDINTVDFSEPTVVEEPVDGSSITEETCLFSPEAESIRIASNNSVWLRA